MLIRVYVKRDFMDSTWPHFIKKKFIDNFTGSCINVACYTYLTSTCDQFCYSFYYITLMQMIFKNQIIKNIDKK